MSKCIKMRRFMQALFDDETQANKAAEIGQAILAARSLRLTDLAAQMEGSSDASYKRIGRFLRQADPHPALWRLFPEQAEFVIGYPTEIERPQAWKTAYVGTLKDGKTKGFWALVLATAYRGRAIPCGLITYSSPFQNFADYRLLPLQSFSRIPGVICQSRGCALTSGIFGGFNSGRQAGRF